MLLILGPFFVLAMIHEIYFVAILIFAFSAIIMVVKRSDYHLMFLPLLLYGFYLFILLIIIPIFVNIYNLLESSINIYGAVLTIVFIGVFGTILVMRIPSFNFWKFQNLNISIIFAKCLGALLIIFILEPIISLLTSEDLDALTNTASDPVVMAAIGLSISMALLATLVSLFLGVPLGYLFAKHEFAGKSILQGIVDVPVVIPHTVAGIALLIVFGVNGVIGAPLDELNVRFVDAWPGIVVAMMFVSAPFVVNSARDGFSAVDPRYENVARSLGATRIQAFSKVSLRLSAKPIITGAIMSWARAISEFGAIIILVYFPMTAPTLIYDRFTSFGLVESRPIAVLLIIVCLVVFVILRIISDSSSFSRVLRGGAQ
jgi:molybdate/tungstate transport system permease protein